jgi:hypothetical protein
MTHEATAIRELPAGVIDATDIGTYAIEAAVRNYQVFPLRGKTPAIPNPHPRGSRERQTCKGECGLPGHGVLDATTDIDKVRQWWGVTYVGANIGVRVPASMLVLDIDPRNGGLESKAALERDHGPLPETLTTISGREDGGVHLFYRRPPGKLSATRLGPGIDIKTSSGYVAWAPSIHPDTRRPYKRIDRPLTAPPDWLAGLLRPEPVAPQRFPSPSRSFTGPSVADGFAATTSWSEILTPHGWRCVDADPDANGARWLHPSHTSPCSATVRNECLFVYSTSTPFDVTEPGNPRGYTRFRAYAVLNHGGDMSAAARALKGVTR